MRHVVVKPAGTRESPRRFCDYRKDTKTLEQVLRIRRLKFKSVAMFPSSNGGQVWEMGGLFARDLAFELLAK